MRTGWNDCIVSLGAAEGRTQSEEHKHGQLVGCVVSCHPERRREGERQKKEKRERTRRTVYSGAELSFTLGLALKKLTGPNPPARSDHRVLSPNKAAPQQPGIIINNPICQSRPTKGEQKGMLKVNTLLTLAINTKGGGKRPPKCDTCT